MSQIINLGNGAGPGPSQLQAFGQVYNQAVQDIFDGQLFLFDSNGPLINVSHTAGTAPVTIDISGYYLITWLVNANGTGGNITLLQNGVALAQGSYVTSASATEPTGQAIVAAVAGDIFTLRNDTGFLLTTDASAGYTSLSMTFVKLTPTAGSASGATTFPTDVGTAVDLGGILNILGSTGITTTATPNGGNTVTISLPGGGQAIETITGNTGGPVPPSGGTGNLNIVTANTTVDFQGNVGLNTQTLQFGISNLVLGDDLSFVTTAVRNVGLGLSALNAVTSGEDNTALGFGSLTLLTTGLRNTAVGSLSLDALVSGNDNTALGDDALTGLTTGSANIAVGRLSGSAYTSESGNITIGNIGIIADAGYTRIGTSQTQCYVAGIYNVTPAQPLPKPVIIDSNGQLGTDAGTGLLATLTGDTGGAVSPTAGNINIISNVAALNAGSTVSFVGSPGTSTLTLNVTDNGVSQNTIMGLNAGNSNALRYNTGFGYAVLASTSVSAQQNTAVGASAATALTDGIKNVVIGSFAGLALTTGTQNTALGEQALLSLVSGTKNTAIGSLAGGALTTNDSNNIHINSTGTAGDNNTLRIGNATGSGNFQLNKSFIHGIRGITTTNADAIAVLVDSAGQLGTVSSSIRFKENVHDLEHSHVLELRPVAFNYKQDGRPGIGLIAEEVEKIMPSLVAYNQEGEVESVKYHDLPVLLLLEIQKLRKELDELKNK